MFDFSGQIAQIKSLQEKLATVEAKRDELQTQLDEIEEEREEEIKIIQEVIINPTRYAF